MDLGPTNGVMTQFLGNCQGRLGSGHQGLNKLYTGESTVPQYVLLLLLAFIKQVVVSMVSKFWAPQLVGKTGEVERKALLMCFGLRQWFSNVSAHIFKNGILSQWMPKPWSVGKIWCQP